MKYAIDVLGGNDINLADFKKDVLRIAKRLKLNFSERNKESWNLSEDAEGGSSIVLIPMSEEDQEEREEPLLENYKSVLLIGYFGYDVLTLPFLRKLFEEYEDLVIANYENMPSFTDENILFYRRGDLEITKEDDIW